MSRTLHEKVPRTEHNTVVAGRTMLPGIISGFQQIANASNPLKFVYDAISYKPFISLFNMTGVAETYPQLAGVGELRALLYLASVTDEDVSGIRGCCGV